MKKTIILISSLLALIGCGKKHPPLLITGSMVTSIESIKHITYTGSTIEASHFLIGSDLVHIFDPDYSGAVKRADGNLNNLRLSNINLPHLRFPYSFKHENTFYHLGHLQYGQIEIYTSSDLHTWTHYGTWTQNEYAHIWNVAMIIDEEEQIHFLAEAGSAGNQSGVILAHFRCPTLRSCAKVGELDAGGSPQFLAASDGSLSAIYADISTGVWQIGMATMQSANCGFKPGKRKGPKWGEPPGPPPIKPPVVNQPPDSNPVPDCSAIWTKAPELLSVRSTVHLADPHLTELADGRKFLTFSYDQLYTVSVLFR